MDFKINADYASRAYNADYTSAYTSSKAGSVKAADYDKVSIQKNAVPSDEDFAAMLSHAMASSLKFSADQSKVDELHTEVQSGSYQPNSARIAERLLGYYNA